METQYAVHSVVRKAAFRTHRAQLPAHLRKKHYICAQKHRLVPGRQLLITEAVLQEHLPELREKAAMHILEVRTTDGRLVDLSTLVAAPAEPTPLRPHPLLDSVANDTPTGQYIPPYVGDDMSMPNVLPPGQKPSLLTQAEETRALDAAAAEKKSEASIFEEELEAALSAAQGEEEPAAPPAQEEVSSSDEGSNAGRRGKKNRR